MKIAMIVVSSLLEVVVVASASAKRREVPALVETMNHVGVGSAQVPRLALLEIVGRAGPLIGLADALIGRRAATGPVLHFLGAVGAHQRVQDRVRAIAPALVVSLVAVATLIMQIRR